MNLINLFEESSRKNSRRCAIICERERLSYHRLSELVDQFAFALKEKLGLRPQDKVAILLENSPWYVVALLATVKAGGVAVPLNSFLKDEELIYILRDSQSKILFTSERFLKSRKKEKRGEDPASSLKSFRQRVETLSEIVLADSAGADSVGLSDLIKRRREAFPAVAASDDDLALLIYTSGTTGHPKGVMLSHKNLSANVSSCISAIEVKPRDRFLVILPMFHSFTLTVTIFLPLFSGAMMVVVPSIRPFSRVIKNVLFHRVSIVAGIPQLYKVLAALKIPALFKLLLNIRLCVSGAAPLEKMVFHRFEKQFRFPLLEGYGLSEASPVVSLNPLKGVKKAGSVGLPLPGVEVKVVDDEEKELPPSCAGELIVRGSNVMLGYLNREDETSRVLKKGWLLTGDIAQLDEDGYIYIVDRKKDMIISHGLNIYPKEIEDIIRQLSAIKEVAVVGKPDRHRGEIPIAAIVLEEGEKISAGEITAYCRERLAAYKVPHQVEFVSLLPMTPTGKVLKRELRKRFK